MNIDAPRNPNPNPPEGESSISIYLYQPWKGAAVAGAVLFGIFMLIQLYYMFARSRRTRWFHGLLAFGAVRLPSPLPSLSLVGPLTTIEAAPLHAQHAGSKPASPHSPSSLSD